MFATDHPDAPRDATNGENGNNGNCRDDDDGDDDDDNDGGMGGTAANTKPLQTQPQPQPPVNDQVDEIATRFLNRGKGWQKRVNLGKTITAPPQLPGPSKPLTTTIKTEPPTLKGAEKARTKPRTRSVAKEQEQDAISRILKLVKKGNMRGVRLEASIKKIETRIQDIEETLDGIQTHIARKFPIILCSALIFINQFLHLQKKLAEHYLWYTAGRNLGGRPSTFT